MPDSQSLLFKPGPTFPWVAGRSIYSLGSVPVMVFVGAAAVRAVDQVDKLQNSQLQTSFGKLDCLLLGTDIHSLGRMSDSQ